MPTARRGHGTQRRQRFGVLFGRNRGGVKTKEPLPEALEDPKMLASTYRKLIRAGFSSSNVIRALKQIAKQQDLLDAFEPPEEAEEV